MKMSQIIHTFDLTHQYDNTIARIVFEIRLKYIERMNEEALESFGIYLKDFEFVLEVQF